MASNKSTREQIGVDLPEPQQVEMEVEEQEVEEPARPEWLPEKFKDEEEFANSYRNLEDELRRRGEDQRRMEQQLSNLQQSLEEDREQRQNPPQQQFGSPEYAGQLREQLNVAYESDPVGTMAWLAQQYAQQTVEQRFAAMQQEQAPIQNQQAEQQSQLLAMTVDRTLGERYNDWDSYKEKVAGEIRQDPSLLPPEMLNAGPDVAIRQLTRVYEMVKARDVLNEAQNGNFVSNELNQMKRQSQTISGQGSRPGEPSPDEEHFARLKAAAKGMSYSSWRES